jgi:succinate dehydrogenase subunit C
MSTTKLETDRAAIQYTEFHPRWYRPRVSVYWWLGQRQYLKFILRELSSVFVAIFVIMTLCQLRALKAGPEAYSRFQESLQSPWVIALNAVLFLFVVFHAITWFNLAPSAMPVRLGGKRVPDFLVAAPSYFMWIVISAFVAWLVLQ